MSAGRRYFVKIRKWLWLPAIVLAFVAGSLSRDGSGDAPGAMTSTEQEAATPASWTCSMHPQIVLPSNDQQCPICFMDLIPVDTSGGSQLAPDALSLSEAAVALAEIETTPVERRFVERPVRLTGKVAVAEDNLRSVTARFGGRLDRLYVSVTGQYVEAGAKLDVPIDDFAQKVMGQHTIVTYGDNTDTFTDLCGILGVEVL